MSIFASWAAPDDREHEDDCAHWLKHDGYWEPSGKPCDCGQPHAPIIYPGSHVLPSDDDPRGGSVDIASILKSNDRGLAWRKEDMKLRTGDEEKMKAQGVLEAQVWSRSDGRAFATFIRGYDMTSKEKVLLEVLLIGSKAGVKMLTDMTSNKQAFAAKPIP